MRKSITVLILTTAGFLSCNQGSKSTSNNVDIETSDSVKNIQSEEPSINDKDIYTKYEYTDSNGNNLIIQNGYPRGGIKYIAPDGEEYVYAIFWTRIINETDNPLELEIDFPLDSYELPSAPGTYFKIVLPSDKMTIDKVPLIDYGLDLKFFLDNNLHKSASLKRTINPKESSAFYVVTLTNRGVDGTLRTGLSIKGPNLFYTINDLEIQCGKINFNDLTLQK